MKTVLIVDDDSDVNMALSGFFLRKGARVLSAANLAEGRAKAVRKKIDFALIDYQLGDGFGTDLLVEIRKEHPEATVIMMSGFEQRIVGEVATAQGADLFLRKPLDFDLLERWLTLLTPTEAPTALAG